MKGVIRSGHENLGCVERDVLWKNDQLKEWYNDDFLWLLTIKNSEVIRCWDHEVRSLIRKGTSINFVS